jgi:single-strand DNA-binding protein
MPGDAQVTLTGNVSQVPEVRFTPSGRPVCNFSIACTGRRKDAAGNYKDGDPSFYRVTVWGEFGEHVAESLTLGARVIITGDLSIRAYTAADGTTGRSAEIDAQDVGPSLRFATAKVVKAPAGNAPASPAPVPS